MKKLILLLALIPSIASAQWVAVRNDNATTTLVGTNGRPGPAAMTAQGALFCAMAPAATTSIAKAEDAVSLNGDTGAFVLGVRQDALATLSSATGDYSNIKVDADERLYTNPFGTSPDRMLVACSGTSTTTADTVIVPAVASNRIYVTSFSCDNNSAVASRLSLKDGAAARWVYSLGANTLSSNVFFVVFPTPMRGTVNTVLQFQMVTTSTSTVCCATYFTSPN